MGPILDWEGISLEQSLPEEVMFWLAELSLLKGVPLRYWVPHAAMLPSESIRFFHVDPNWIHAVHEGALSIGRQTAADWEVDVQANRELHTRTESLGLRSRSRRMHPNHLRNRCVDETNNQTHFSGFVMRSVLVRHWKGVEVLGFTAQGQTCSIARMEQLGDSLLLCIFAGEIDKVVLNEPAEALHFGVKDGKINIRAITGAVGSDTGKVIQAPVTESGRLEVWELVERIAQEGLHVSRDTITSAELALQLLNVADQCEFQQAGK